jgi:hypothetical protein
MLRTQHVKLGRKGQIGEIGPVIGQPLLNFENLDTFDDPRRSPELLGAGDFTSMTSGAVLVINQQPVLGFFLATHGFHPCRL